jgi:hypothetical protein
VLALSQIDYLSPIVFFWYGMDSPRSIQPVNTFSEMVGLVMSQPTSRPNVNAREYHIVINNPLE